MNIFFVLLSNINIVSLNLFFIMKKRILFFSLFFSFTSIQMFAQLKVGINGEVIIGKPATYGLNGVPPYDNDGSINQIYGPYGNYGAGGRLSFGDFLLNYPVHNVMIGEYTNDDTDQLWLHGKKGIYITKNNPHNAQYDIVAYYDLSQGNYFQFNCDVKSTGIFVASDSSFKENITPVKNTLSNLKKINAVSYKLKLGRTEDAEINNINTSLIYSEKEKKQIELQRKYNEKIETAPKRFGVVAQEVEKVYPQLVSKDDSTGYLYVDYIGLIPLTIEAISELDSAISQKDAEIQELKDYVTGLEEKINNLTNLVTGNTSIIESRDINNVAKVFENTPNPFKENTMIRYTLPESVKKAYLYIYDLQGKQLKSISISERGNSSIIIYGSELSAGTYIYTLIADQKEVGTHKMILTQ
ncbi:MAG: tail fiber domain-containing protein [Dysgonomonas sp.]